MESTRPMRKPFSIRGCLLYCFNRESNPGPLVLRARALSTRLVGSLPLDTIGVKYPAMQGYFEFQSTSPVPTMKMDERSIIMWRSLLRIKKLTVCLHLERIWR